MMPYSPGSLSGISFASSLCLRRQFFVVSAMRLWLCAFLILIVSAAGFAKEPPAKKWVGTWATAPQLVEPNNMPPAPGLSNNTLRQVVCVSIGGKKLQLKFSNKYGKSPVTMKNVYIAVSKGGSAIDAATSKTLTFDGKQEITMEPGTEVTSDAVSFNLKPRMEVAITISFGETSPTLTGHPGSRTTSYLLTGNQSSPQADFTNAVKTDHWYIITGIDVQTKKSGAAVAIIGDSITDGRGSGTNKQNRWPDILAMKLLANRKTKQIGVLNMGIGGNTVLRGGLGPTALTRFDRDILQQEGVRWLIIYEGVNDLGSTRDSAAAFNVANGLIAAYDTMIAKARAKGLKVYGATITPFKKAGYYTPYRDAARNFVNEWIRTSGHFDAVIDFDKAIRDPQDVATIREEAQADYLHPNELGYKIMGHSVDLSLFK
jgi:lysophospholipase L1-like esterase